MFFQDTPRRFAYGSASRGKSNKCRRNDRKCATDCFSRDGASPHGTPHSQEQGRLEERLQEILQGLGDVSDDKGDHSRAAAAAAVAMTSFARGRDQAGCSGRSEKDGDVDISGDIAIPFLEEDENGMLLALPAQCTAFSQCTARPRLRMRRSVVDQASQLATSPGLLHSNCASPSESEVVAAGDILVDGDLLNVATSASKLRARKQKEKRGRNQLASAKGRLKTSLSAQSRTWNSPRDGNPSSNSISLLLEGSSPLLEEKRRDTATQRKAYGRSIAGLTPGLTFPRSRFGVTSPRTYDIVRSHSNAKVINMDGIRNESFETIREVHENLGGSAFKGIPPKGIKQDMDEQQEFSTLHKDRQKRLLEEIKSLPRSSPLAHQRRQRASNPHGSLYSRMQHVISMERAAVEYPEPNNAPSWLTLRIEERWNDVGVLQVKCTVQNAEDSDLPEEVVAFLPMRVRQSIDIYPGMMLQVGAPWRLKDNPLKGGYPPLLLCSGAVRNA